MHHPTLSLLLAGIVSCTSNMALAATSPLSERDECISNLRGLADMNAQKNDYTVVKIHLGEYETKPDGSVSCSAQFVIVKDDQASLSPLHTGEVFKDPH